MTSVSRGSLPEILLLMLLGVGGFVFLSLNAGGPLTWDELLYMEASWNPKEVPWILNRYAHIHLQSLFMHLLGDPLAGARVYWGFLISATLVGVYLGARLLAQRSPRLTGLLAVVLFLHLRLPFRYAGTTYADFTLMTFSVWAGVVFILGGRSSGRTRTSCLALLGLLLFLALKSKDHGLLLLLLLFGLGRTGASFSAARLRSDLLAVVTGLALGLLGLMVVDGVVLGNPLFSIQPGNVDSLLDYNVGAFEERSPDSYLELLASKTLVLPFLLYLLAFFIRTDEEEGPAEKILLSIPLAHILFLIGALVFVKYRVSDRQLIGALPLLCVGAAQFFQPAWGNSEEKRRTAAPFLATAVLAGLSVLLKLPERIAAGGGWTSFPLESAILYPGGALLLAVMAAWFRRESRPWKVFLLGLVFWMTLIPGVRANLSSLIHDEAGKESRRRFLPLEIFREQIPMGEGARYLVSERLYNEMGVFGRSAESCSMMFDLHFAVDTDPDQFEFVPALKAAPLGEGFDAAFGTAEDLASLPLGASGEVNLGEKQYTLFQDESSGLIFLLGELDPPVIPAKAGIQAHPSLDSRSSRE